MLNIWMSEHSQYPKKAGIYKLTCINNSKSYVGKSVNIYKRLSRHKNCNKSHKSRGFLQNAIIKHGWESFKVEILEIFENFDKVKDNDTLLEKESYYIKVFNTTDRDKGYNICEFSTDSTGRNLTDEHKEKIRQSHLGKTYTADHREKIRIGKALNPMSEKSKASLRAANLGKKMSEEAREKMRMANLGRKLSQETKDKIGVGNLGKIVSDETREKIRNGHIGKAKKPWTDEQREKIKQTKLRNKYIRENI